MNTTDPVCPKCGASLPANSPAGLCARCLMTMNLATQTVLSEESGGSPSEAKPAPPTPEQIATHFPGFEILECLGRGGMGVVYKARQKSLNRLVALKILAPEREQDAAFAQRFAVEAGTLARLNHPGIVTIYDFGQADGLFYFVMEFVDGVSLRQLLSAGRVAPREALAIVPEICDALQYAHDQGIVHRDIKPENILLDRRGRVKVADFGLAKLVNATADISLAGPTTGGPDRLKPGLQTPVLTDAGKVMGTPQYMAPEQAEKPAEVDHRADIYALGVVFYQMLTGELPGKPLQPPSRKVHIDVRLDEVVMRALETDPGRRYSQASVLKTQVETIVAQAAASDAPISAPPEPRGVATLPRLSRAASRTFFLSKIGLLLFVLLGAAAFILYRSVHRESPGSIESVAESPWKLRKIPTVQVIEAGMARPELPWAWQELEKRARTGGLNPADGGLILDGLTAWLRQDYPNGYAQPLHWVSGLLEELHKCGLIPEAAALQFLKAFHGDPSCEPLPRLREATDTLNLTCNWRNTWHQKLLGLVLLNEIRSITIDGQSVDWGHNPGWSWDRDHFYSTVQLPELAPGKHTLKCEIDSALVADKDMVGLADETPSQDWPPAKKRWTRSLQAELTVYSKDAEIVKLTQDPALDPVASGALSVKQVVVRRKGDGAAVVALFNITDKLPVPISFEVTLRVGGQTVNCGNFWSAKGTPGHSNSQGGTELKADIDLLDQQVKEAEIILTSNPGPVEPLAGVDRIWGKEVKFSHVPLTRYDIR